MLTTDVERYEKGKELLAAKNGAMEKIESLKVILSGLENMKTEMSSNPIFTPDDLNEVNAEILAIKNKITTELL